MYRINNLCAVLDAAGIGYIKNAMLRDYCTFRIGGPAAVIAFPADAREMRDVITGARHCDVDYFLLGNGSNVLFDDEGYAGVIVTTTAMGGIDVSGDTIRAGCGAPLARIALSAVRGGLAGAEFLYGIPGSCGGAVYMNAGAYGSQMSDIVESVSCLDATDGSIVELDVSGLDYSYRHSLFMERRELIILSALLRLASGEPREIEEKMKDNMMSRRGKQPLDYPSAGSVFKRRPGYFMGKIIEDSGLKGFCIGGAAISPKHAGFIINTGGATAADVVALICHIKATILLNYGFEPECEVIIPGKGCSGGKH